MHVRPALVAARPSNKMQLSQVWHRTCLTCALNRNKFIQEVFMTKAFRFIGLFCVCLSTWFPQAAAQDKKLEKIRIGGGAVGAPQMTMWFAKEANLYEKHGLAAEAIHIPGSSMALQAMLAAELPIIQLGGTASMQANFAGADTVIVATVLKK